MLEFMHQFELSKSFMQWHTEVIQLATNLPHNLIIHNVLLYTITEYTTVFTTRKVCWIYYRAQSKSPCFHIHTWSGNQPHQTQWGQCIVLVTIDQSWQLEHAVLVTGFQVSLGALQSTHFQVINWGDLLCRQLICTSCLQSNCIHITCSYYTVLFEANLGMSVIGNFKGYFFCGSTQSYCIGV